MLRVPGFPTQESGGSGMGLGAMIGIGAAANVASSFLTNQQNRGIAQDQMDFQKRMSGTMHQREVADLKAAGLNPILSANSGASSPSGAGIPMQAPQIDLPAIMQVKQLQQADQKLGQDQQQININKANSAAGIAKSLSDQELNRANTLGKRGGALTNWLGTDVFEKTNRPVFNPLRNVQPRRTPPSSMGEIPGGMP